MNWLRDVAARTRTARSAIDRLQLRHFGALGTLAVVVALVSTMCGPVILRWLALGLAAVGLVIDVAAREYAADGEAANLPGYRAGLGNRRLSWPLAAVAAAVVVLALTPLPDGVEGAALAAASLVLAAVAARTALSLRGRDSVRARIDRAVHEYAPDVAVYTARSDGSYQLTMWLPVLASLGTRAVVITRSPAAVAALAPAVDVPVVAYRDWRDLDRALVPSLKVCLYPNNVSANADFVTYRQIWHVYVGHGESDKALSYHPAHAMFDKVFVAGPAAIRRYAQHQVSVPEDLFTIIGRPQTAGISRRTGPANDESQSEPIRRVLYAPTWEGFNARTAHSSLPYAHAVIDTLLAQGWTVTFRPHPFSLDRIRERTIIERIGRRLSSHAQQSGREHRVSIDASLVDDINNSDALVSDISSVPVDYLASDKPMVVLAPGDPEDIRSRYPSAACADVVSLDGDLSGIPALLLRDESRAQRAAARKLYTEPHGSEHVSQLFADALLPLLTQPRPSARP